MVCTKKKVSFSASRYFFLSKLNFLDRFLEKYFQIPVFVKIRPVGTKLFHAEGRKDGRTDGRTDMTKLMVTFQHFSSAPTKNTMAPTGACACALSQFSHSLVYFPCEQNTMKGQWTRPQAGNIRLILRTCVESSWNVMAHGDAREGKWRGKLANGVGSQYSSHYLGTWCIQHYYRWWRTPRLPVVDWTDAHRRFKWTRPFRRKTKYDFCACAITFQLASTVEHIVADIRYKVLL